MQVIGGRRSQCGAAHDRGLLSFRVGCLSASQPISRSRLSTSKRFSQRGDGWCGLDKEGSGCYLVGGQFALTGSHADILLSSLPPIVHIRKESDKAAMRWSLERMKEELRDPQSGGSLIAQQLAYVMLARLFGCTWRMGLDRASAGSLRWRINR